MSDTLAQMRERLAVLAPQALEIFDDSAAHAGHAHANGGGHYRLVITAPCFQGQSRIARHRIIHRALGDLLPARIHALAICARAPSE